MGELLQVKLTKGLESMRVRRFDSHERPNKFCIRLVKQW